MTSFYFSYSGNVSLKVLLAGIAVPRVDKTKLLNANRKEEINKEDMSFFFPIGNTYT